MAYSTVDDLFLGDITLGANINPTKFVDEAALEIDSKIGQTYVLPLVADDDHGFDVVPQFTLDNLSKINNWLASGRLILAINATSGDDTLNGYGAMLVKDATAEIEAIKNGLQDLIGAKRAPLRSAAGDTYNGPTLVNADSVSAVDTFYAGVMGGATDGEGRMPQWRPNV